MAKDLPYFKFDVAEWINGSITLESYSAQGLFINICSHYWFKSGLLSLTEIKRRLSSGLSDDFDSLISNGIIHVENDMLRIKFLDEQIQERNDISKKNSVNGSKGGRPKATALRSISQNKANESNIEESRGEKNIIIHGKGKRTINIKRVFAGDPIHKIHDLQEYYKYSLCLDDIEDIGLVHFQAFMEVNSGKIYNDHSHLDNAFRSFCRSYEPPARAPDPYKDAQWDKEALTKEAWEDLYQYKLNHDGEFRKHFGYAEPPNGKAVGKLNTS